MAARNTSTAALIRDLTILTQRNSSRPWHINLKVEGSHTSATKKKHIPLPHESLPTSSFIGPPDPALEAAYSTIKAGKNATVGVSPPANQVKSVDDLFGRLTTSVSGSSKEKACTSLQSKSGQQPKSPPKPTPSRLKHYEIEPEPSVIKASIENLVYGHTVSHKQTKQEKAVSGRKATKSPVFPLPYSRRIEGFLGASDKSRQFQDIAPPSEHRPIASLEHGLDRVLFNPGVHWLQDPRSRVFNFTPWLEAVPDVRNFAFERVQGFIKSSTDEDLRTLARRENCVYAGSTSSLTGMLCHIYMMLSGEKPLNLDTLSSAFSDASNKFTPGQKLPTSVVLHYKDGVYATDSDNSAPGMNEKNVLTWMGTMLEKFLTTPKDKFEALMRGSTNATDIIDDGKREAYRYAKVGKFMMRSQLDCVDKRLPGTGVFDIKTRAALPIRMDQFNWEENSGYLIKTHHGKLESFEREYYDLIRSAFLKYSFQARIGNMDGILIAYHNTARIFGFQYVPLEEMEERLYGDKGAGQEVFEKCVHMLEVIMNEVTSHFPEQSVRCSWEANPQSGSLSIFVEPTVWKSKEARPIVELQVDASNFVDNQPMSGADAIELSPSYNWSVHYKIVTSSLSYSEIRARRTQLHDRQIHLRSLPSGMSLSEFKEHWPSINYGGGNLSTAKVPFDSKLFKEADRRTEKLRDLARAGREETERLATEEVGKRKIVWGQPDERTVEEASAQEDAGVPDSSEDTDAMDELELEVLEHEAPKDEDEGMPEPVLVAEPQSLPLDDDTAGLRSSYPFLSAFQTSFKSRSNN